MRCFLGLQNNAQKTVLLILQQIVTIVSYFGYYFEAVEGFIVYTNLILMGKDSG